MAEQIETIQHKVFDLQKKVRELEIEAHGAGLSLEFVLMTIKRQFIVAALERNGNNRSKVAREFNWHRNTLSYNLASLKIDNTPNVGRHRKVVNGNS